jgi:magnesium transporter
MSMNSSAPVRSLDAPVVEHMITDIARLNVDLTVGEALLAIRENPPSGRIIYFYVVDAQNRLQGVVPTRRLLLNAPEKLLADIMVREVVVIPSQATILDACEFFALHHLLAFPVVDAQRHLLGIIDVSLYTDEIEDLEHRQNYDELFELIGVHLTDAQQASSWLSFRHRFPWLLANIAGGILAAFLTGLFEVELKKAVALALFIPVVLALGESVSIQSVSLALQSLRGKRLNFGEIMRKLRAESLTGMLLGCASASMVSVVAWLWLGDWRIVVCLLGGIIGGVTFAAVVGLAMPSILRLLRSEPHVASGPISLAVADAATLLVYFMLARSLF